MAIVYVRGAGMTAEDREGEDTSVSALKEETEYDFPDDENVSVVPGALSADERAALSEKIRHWEKDNLIARKNSGDIGGTIRDTRGRYGEPKQWDHLQLSLDREESEHYTRADLDKARRIIRDIAARDISGQYKKMSISRVHTDTGNTHVDVLVHRHPYDTQNKQTLPADELTNSSRLSSVIEKINNALRAEGLPIIKDVKKQDGQSLYEETATSDAAKKKVNELVQKEGGIATQRTGAPVVPGDDEPRQERARILDPDVKALERLVNEAEREAKAAAQRLVSAQHALAAHAERAILLERANQLDAQVAEQTEKIKSLNGAILEKEEALAVANARITEVEAESNNFMQDSMRFKSLLDDEIEKHTTLKQEYKGLDEEKAELESKLDQVTEKASSQEKIIEELKASIAETQAANQEKEKRLAEAAEHLQAEQQQRKADNEAARAERDKLIKEAAERLRAEQEEREFERKAAQDALSTAAEQLRVEQEQRNAENQAAKAERENDRTLFQKMYEEMNKLKDQLVSNAQAALENLKSEFASYKASSDKKFDDVQKSLSNSLRERDDQIAKLKAELEKQKTATPAGTSGTVSTTTKPQSLTPEEAAEKRRRAEAKRGDTKTPNSGTNDDPEAPTRPKIDPKKPR